MPSSKLSAIALAAIVGLATIPATADAAYVFTFAQAGPTYTDGTGYTPAGPTSVYTAGGFSLDNSIVGKNYTIAASNNGWEAPKLRGLIDIMFATLDRGAMLIGDLARFTTPYLGSSGPYYGFSLTGVAGSVLPTGTIYFNNTESDTRLEIGANGVVSGTYNTDRGGACGSTGACSFMGLLTALDVGGANGNGNGNGNGNNGKPTSVPEPMSLALFGMGLVGLVAVLRRKLATA